MADEGEKVEEQLRDITECSICMSAFTDPRVLPCIHTFCFECLNRTGEAAQKKPTDKMPCPLCRKEFIIPADGVNGVQKNFFMDHLLEFKTMIRMRSSTVVCDICNIRNEGKTGQLPTATMRCLECRDNYCDSCIKVHQFQKVSRDHQVVLIGSDTESETRFISAVKYCTKHTQNPLEYYCPKCNKIVCVSCLLESHSNHYCKGVTTFDEGFRQTIKTKVLKISNYRDELTSFRKITEKRKEEFLKEIIEKENAIHKRHQELKDMIDENTKLLLDDLSAIKSNNLKEMEIEMKGIEVGCTIFRSFEVYCTELRLRGSASDICSSVHELLVRAEELEKDHNAFIDRPHQSVEVSFQATDLGDVLQKSNKNIVGQVKEAKTQFEDLAVVVGMSDGTTCTKDAVKIDLHRPNRVSDLTRIPGRMKKGTTATANVYCDTLYATGIGGNADEIWKYKQVIGWKQCASLVQGRRRHSASFIDEVLYICGGFAKSTKLVLDSVEAYNAVTNKCTAIGKLVHSVYSSGNCVPFGNSVYIFGGSDKDDNNVSCVQVYNTKENTCTLLTKPMPDPYMLMRGIVWQTSAILLGRDTCFIFNFETETWLERKQFKTDVFHFGLVLENEQIFVIGGGEENIVENGKKTWKCRDDVRYIPLQNILEDKLIDWKIHGKLPTPSLVHACVKMQFPV